MRLEIGFLPDPVDQCFADAEMLGEFATGPVGGTVGGFATGGVEDAGPQSRGEFLRRLAGAVSLQPVESLLEETLFPLANGWGGGVELVCDGLVGEAVGQQQQDFSPPNETGGQ